jgi:small subunit ribosomal protein S9
MIEVKDLGVGGGGTLSTTPQPVEGAPKTRLYGTGRRKKSVARVFIAPGSGKMEVNNKPVNEYFPNVAWLTRAIEPLKFTGMENQLDVWATVNGGGVGGQSGSVRMGLSRALAAFNPELRSGLRKNGFLTRDSRRRERKKYGQKGARKRFQFSKR